MWARWCEAVIGLWLIVSPWLLGTATQRPVLVAVTVVGGLAALVLALMSMWPRPRRAHLVTFGVSLALFAVGWALRAPRDPATENLVVTGLVLWMFTIVPNAASHPPAGYRAPSPRP